MPFVRLPGGDPFGAPTMSRPWDDNSNSMDNAKKRLRAGFEFMSKLGVKHWTFHDRYHVSQSIKTLILHIYTTKIVEFVCLNRCR